VIDAIAALAPDCPRLHLMIVGRGGPEEFEEAVTRPLARAGCSDRVHLAGYLRGDDLVAAYRRMHALAYPAPGTDKSCRTVREAMAAGVSVIGARVGYVPHLVDHEKTGLLASQDAQSFAAGIRRMYDDAIFLQRLREASLSGARERFSLEAQARRALAFYDSLA
jgi:glycosyltransferase involved in cell wall biosynthesis